MIECYVSCKDIIIEKRHNHNVCLLMLVINEVRYFLALFQFIGLIDRTATLKKYLLVILHITIVFFNRTG